jgi:predicted metal-dependent hydrolase
MLHWRNKKHYAKHKEAARALAHTKVGYFNTFYNLPVGKVFIKNTKSRWASCSEKGNLNFNYKIVLLPPHVADYLVIHELCHLGEFNHGPKFWALVSQCCPNYRQVREELRAIERQ